VRGAVLGPRVTRAPPVGPHLQPGLRERPERRAQLRQLLLSCGVRHVSQVQHLVGGGCESERASGAAVGTVCRLAHAGASRNSRPGARCRYPQCPKVTQDQDGCWACARGGGAGRAGAHTGGSGGCRVTSLCKRREREGEGASAACSCGAPLMALLRRVCLVPCLLLVLDGSQAESERRRREKNATGLQSSAQARHWRRRPRSAGTSQLGL